MDGPAESRQIPSARAWAAAWGVLLGGVAGFVLSAAFATRTLAARSSLAAWSTLVLGLSLLAAALLFSLPRLLHLLRTSARRPGGVGARLAGPALALASLLFALLFLELALRAYYGLDGRLAEEAPLHIPCGECPELYVLNPAHALVSQQGLRDREVEVPKPEGLYRILALGDSVTYGPLVGDSERFTEVLERNLGRRARVEVVNAGVSGYTAYNELQLYRRLGPELAPDLTFVAFVLNDVANPRLHWGYTREKLGRIPAEAIPNLAYDRLRNRPWKRTMLYRFLHLRLRLVGPEGDGRDARGWRTRITGEDPLSIEVLLDYESPEWRWLRGIYDRLAEETRRHGSRLAIVILPLAYQLEEGYPYLPQRLFARYCRERALPCLDPLPAMRGREAGELFLGQRSGYQDYWHLSEEGHRLVAAELEAFLAAEGLLPKGSAG